MDKNFINFINNRAERPFDFDRGSGVGQSQDKDLGQKIIKMRNRVYNYIMLHYYEILINLRDYENTPKSFNKYVAEVYLRNGYDVVLGKNKRGNDCILGYLTNDNSVTNGNFTLAVDRLNANDFNWLIPKRFRPDRTKMQEITNLDNAETGNFAVLRNKVVTYLNDFNTVEMYASRIAELQASRFSLIIQAKTARLIQTGDEDNETVDQIINALYNGQPYIKTDDMFTPSDMIDFGDMQVADKLKTLKSNYNDEISELNNALGINTGAIDKESGVSVAETKSNDDYVSAVDNIYIRGVQEGLDLYNKRFNKNYRCFMRQVSINNDVASNMKGDEKKDENNNNTPRDNDELSE